MVTRAGSRPDSASVDLGQVYMGLRVPPVKRLSPPALCSRVNSTRADTRKAFRTAYGACSVSLHCYLQLPCASQTLCLLLLLTQSSPRLSKYFVHFTDLKKKAQGLLTVRVTKLWEVDPAYEYLTPEGSSLFKASPAHPAHTTALLSRAQRG